MSHLTRKILIGTITSVLSGVVISLFGFILSLFYSGFYNLLTNYLGYVLLLCIMSFLMGILAEWVWLRIFQSLHDRSSTFEYLDFNSNPRAIGNFEYEGLRLKYEVYDSDVSIISADCPKCKCEMEQQDRFIRGTIFFCPDCQEKIKNKKDYSTIITHAKSIIERDLSMYLK